MRKIYHLGNCGTCQDIIRNMGIDRKNFIMQEIKSDPLTEKQLDQLMKMAGPYEALFSRRALKYKSLGLKDRKLTEADYRKHILGEYLF